MANARPIRTPDEREASEIINGAQSRMMEKVHAAVAEASAQVREELRAAGLDLAPAPKEYFEAVVHQQMYLALCGAARGTFEGGDAQKAIGLIRNQQKIANHYWGADIKLTSEIR